MDSSLKCYCPHCNGQINFDATTAGTIMTCPHCEKDVQLPAVEDNAPTQPISVPHPIPKLEPLPKTAQESAKERLASIRANSCYGVLRATINVGAILVGLAAFVGVLRFLADAIDSNYWIMKLGFFAGVILAVILVIAVRQSALLVVDIADSLLQPPPAQKH